MITGRPASVSCTGKRGYASRRNAKDVIKTMKATGKLRRGVDGKSRLTEYPCYYCGMWHLGNIDRANWNGATLDPSTLPDLKELRKRPRLNGPVMAGHR